MSVEITDMPLRAVVVPEVADTVCGLLGNRICCPPDWAWEVRWGPKDPEYGIADRSLGHYWYEFGQWAHLYGCKKKKTVASIPVTYDWVRENWPDAGGLDEIDKTADGGT